jgi:RND family efflux transporter MFP subunit
MKIKRVVLPLMVIVVAIGLTFVLVKSRKVPLPKETPHLGPLVEVTPLARTRHQVVVTGTGTVQPRFEVTITPQVKGRISEISPRMVAGGQLRKGELLFAIEDEDYRLAIELARSSLAQAELELLRNENLAEVARREWRELNPGSREQPNPLVVYEPQLKSARAQRDAALANVRQAEINLQRTRVFAPFNCSVRSEQVEVGQFVNAGSPVAIVLGTDQLEIAVPLPIEELAWLQVPRSGGAQRGARAEVVLQTGGQIFRWWGEVTRALGEIDPRSRMARLVVTVANPVSADGPSGNLLNELLPGMFVEVRLQGDDLDNIFAVPRSALHDNDTLWIVDDENRLHIRPVEILRREPGEVLIRTGLEPGEKLVLTSLSAAAEGMLLRPQLREAGQ